MSFALRSLGRVARSQMILHNRRVISTSHVLCKDAKSSKKNQCCLVTEEKELGQPTYWTHPHLFDSSPSGAANVKEQQVTPGISKGEFEERRDNYVRHLTTYQMIYFATKFGNGGSDPQAMKQYDHNFIAVIPSCMTTFMAPDVPHTFKQNSDFLYLTGFREPNSVLVISRTDADDIDAVTRSYKAALFIPGSNPDIELWSGPSTPTNMIERLCGIKHAYNISEFKDYLGSLMKESTNRRTTLWRYPTLQVTKEESGPNCVNEKIENALDEFAEATKSTSTNLIDMNDLDDINASHSATYYNSSRYFVQLCRFKKSKSEIAQLRQACNIASEAFVNSMKISHPLINEHLIYSKFDFDCRTRGAEYLSYIPVIAGGPRATVLHYIRNNQIIKPNSMVLMDAGCQYRDYSSDITRTWPVSGKYSRAQRDIYQACLNVQKACLKHCHPGMQLGKLYHIMLKSIGDELSQIGIIDRKEHEEAVNSGRNMPITYMKKLTKYCPHDIGHYLGMDIHDCPEITKAMELEEGAVITVEPGIYIRPDDESVPPGYRGIGVRIEDDVAITESGHEVLSKNCPKEIDEIENILMK